MGKYISYNHPNHSTPFSLETDSEWDVVALKTDLDSPFTSARLGKMADYFMALQIIELEKKDSFYSGSNIYDWPLSDWLYSLTTKQYTEGNNND